MLLLEEVLVRLAGGAHPVVCVGPNAPAEPILLIRRIRKVCRAPETPGGPLALKEGQRL